MVQELTGDSASEQWMQEFGNDENAGDAMVMTKHVLNCRSSSMH